MAGSVRYLLQRASHYHARIRVPVALQPIVGKVELLTPLGSDRRAALRRLPGAVAALQDRLDRARASLAQGTRPRAARPRPLDPEEMARIHYARAVESDSFFRNADRRYAAGFVDEDHVRRLRLIISGSATDEEIKQSIGLVIEYFRRRGNHSHTEGSPGWRGLARIIGQAELEGLRVTAARDDGDPDPVPPPFLEPKEPAPPDPPAGLRIGDIFEGYRKELQAAGKARNAEHRWKPIVNDLVDFLGHDRAARVTRGDALRWKDKLLADDLAPKTVRDMYVATARAAFGWGLANELVAINPFASIKVIVPRKVLGRERGYNDAEAIAVLKAARAYATDSAQELPQTVAAKRWAPFLAAYTGARITEITQLRAEDVKAKDGIDYVRITPEAGTVKSGLYRDVPLHPHLIELGFLDYVKSVGTGALFFRGGRREGRASPASVVASKVGKWVRSLGTAPEIQPNHGWRHRLKTQGRELGIDPRVLDAIQGHAARTAGDDYGDVTLKAKASVIRKLPAYKLDDVAADESEPVGDSRHPAAAVNG